LALFKPDLQSVSKEGSGWADDMYSAV